MYTVELIDHFENPRNYGKMKNPHVIGELNKADLGDSITIYLMIENNFIAEIKYEAFGCPAAMATSSVLSEMIIGKSLDEALTITKEDVAQALGGLPEHKMVCSNIGVEVLTMALKDYKGKNIHNELT